MGELRPNTDHVHEVETTDERIIVNAPEQPVRMDAVRERKIDHVGQRHRMQMIQCPTHQLARMDNHLRPTGVKGLEEGFLRAFFDNLEIAGNDAAVSGFHLRQHIGQRSVGHDVVGYHEEKTGVEHRVAGSAHGTRIGKCNSGRIVVAGNKIVDGPDFDVADTAQKMDGCVIAQLGVADMGVPILYALTYPERRPMPTARLDLVRAGQLTFYEPDIDKFPCLRLARQALGSTSSAPVVLNAANEVAVAAFLAGTIRFDEIHKVNAQALAGIAAQAGECDSAEGLLALDARVRERAARHVKGLAR